MSVTVKVEGLRELERELEKLATPAARKASARRVLKKTAQPIAAAARDSAPRGQGDLAPSITVGTRLSKRQAKQHRRAHRGDKAAVEMFIGPGPDPAAWNQEFGNINHAPQPYMRPAWESGKRQMLDQIKAELWVDIQKAVARAEKRAARLAAKG